MALRALLFDVDGTLAETERDGHRPAFNRAFEAMGLPRRWSDVEYGELLLIAGGKERLRHDMQVRRWGPSEAVERGRLIEELHRLKNQYYAELVGAGTLTLRAGVFELLEDCAREKLPLGIVTTTSRPNIDALLRSQLGGHWESRFASIVSANEAPLKKPNPQAYLMALDALRIEAKDAVALEDAPAGVAACDAAGLPVLITHSFYFPAAHGAGVLARGPSLATTRGWAPAAEAASRIDLEQIRRWHARHRAEAGSVDG